MIAFAELQRRTNTWLIGAVEVLPISPDYFRIRCSLDRGIYEIGRKRCGSQAQLRISLDKRQKKCGSNQAQKYFAEHIRETVANNHLRDDHAKAFNLG